MGLTFLGKKQKVKKKLFLLNKKLILIENSLIFKTQID